MRRHLSQPEKAVTRFLPMLLLVLGLALADLTVVWSAAPGAGPAARAQAAADVSAPGTSATAEVGAQGCTGGACQLATMAAPTGNRSLARSRYSGLVDPGAPRADDLLARLAPLSLLTPSAGLNVQCHLLCDLPRRPPRETGVARSVPRPPPA